MTRKEDLDPYANPQAFYAAELRQLREEAGFTQYELARRVFCSGVYIGQCEQTIRKPQVDLSKMMDDVLGSRGLLKRLAILARRWPVADYFKAALALEPTATSICEYAPVLVPGLLQTEGYAKASIRAGKPFASEDYIEQTMQSRMDRQHILDKPMPPLLWGILSEAVLHLPMGGPKIMHEQLLHLREMSERPRVVVQVLPATAMAQVCLTSMVSIMSFEDTPPVVYSEGEASGVLIEDRPDVERHQQTYDLARAVALSPSESRALLESTAKDYENL